jgi:hypothetical protein
MSHGRGFKGSKYESGRDVKEVAKLVRKDLKAEFGKGYKFSVRISRYAGGQSLTVELVAVPGPMPFYSRERALADERGEVVREPFRSPELAAIVERMDKVVTAYHFDDSDSMTGWPLMRRPGPSWPPRPRLSPWPR